MFLTILTIGGFFFGLWYYQFQLAATNPLLWIVTIDSPLYVLFFSLICITLLLHRTPPSWFVFVTAIGLIKVGFWTDLVLWLYWPQFTAIGPVTSAINFPLHAGMIMLGMLLIPRLRVIRWYVPLVLLWFLSGDIMDYGLGTVTRIPPGWEWLLFPESLAATFVLALGLFWVSRKRSLKAISTN